MNNNPIGILDSGLGGLTIWKEVASLLPQESTVYIADSKNTPYGEKSEDAIYNLSKKLIELLLTKQVKLIVIGCNTITVASLDKLRKDFPQIPIVGTVPVVKTAAERTKNNRIGILSTTHTAESQYQKELIQKFANHCVVFNHGTDTLVPFVERGELEGEDVTNELISVLLKFQQEHVDTIALGCTHFPFLREKMQHILGPTVTILDSGPAIARQVKRVLENNNAVAVEQQPEYSFYTTGDPVIAKKLLVGTIAGEKEFQKISL